MPSMNPVFGGPVTAIHVMASGLQQAGLNVDIATVHSCARSSITLEELKDGVRCRSFPVQMNAYGVSFQMRHWLQAHVHEYDLVHIHGVFSFTCLAAIRAAARAGVPCIVRPFGVLNRWGMERRRSWLKRLVFKWVEKPMLDGVQALHFTSIEESQDVARLGIKAPGTVIPLGLDVAPYRQLPSRSMFEDRFPICKGAKTILFLSRIDAKKGLEVLLPAFKEVLASCPAAKLVIAGDGDRSLMTGLKSKARELAVADSIVWTGFLAGEMRLAALAHALVFCLPSHSENFGMALLEAMAARLPCVATDQVALGAAAAKVGAVHITPVSPAPLAKAIIELLSDERLREELAAKAQDYAVKNHSMAVLAENLKKFYLQLRGSPGGQGGSASPMG